MQLRSAFALAWVALATTPASGLPRDLRSNDSPAAIEAGNIGAALGGSSDAWAPLAGAAGARSGAALRDLSDAVLAKAAPAPVVAVAAPAIAEAKPVPATTVALTTPPPGAPASAIALPDAQDDAESEEESPDAPDDSPAPAASAGEADGSESDSTCPTPAAANGRYYTGDISDAELARLWKTHREALGTVSVGLASAGRLINAEPFPTEGGPWTVVDPHNSYATHQTIQFLMAAFKAVDQQFPGGPPARVNHISCKDGGYLRPHVSHQAGRDADIGLYYTERPGSRVRDRVRYMDLPRNWAFIRQIVTRTDVEMILVDRKIQRALYDYALSIGEDRHWLDTLFHAGSASLLKHARHHRDHFHVRFYDAFAQELGRRVQPLLTQDKNVKSVVMHKVRRGETLGRIAMHYGVSSKVLKQANRLRGSFIRAGHMLAIPVHGCVNCPVPPPIIVPPRRLPPAKGAPAQLSHADGYQRAPAT